MWRGQASGHRGPTGAESSDRQPCTAPIPPGHRTAIPAAYGAAQRTPGRRPSWCTRPTRHDDTTHRAETALKRTDTRQVVPGNRWDLLDVPDIGVLLPRLRISVVIPHYQAAAALDRTLASLAAQSYPRALTELIVVDDGSSPPLEQPGTLAGLDVRVLHQPDLGFGLARARHRGALAATGDVLVFLDADMLCEPGHLEAHARWHHVCGHAVTLGSRRHVATPDDADRTASRDDTGPLPSPQQILDAGREGSLGVLFADRETRAPAWIDRHLARTDQLTSAHDDLFRVVTGGNLGVARSTYLGVGGFDATFTQWGSEDTDLGHRLFLAGAVLVPEPRAACWHQGDSQGLEPAERRSLEEQRARISQTIAHPHFRRMAPGRAFEVPWVVVEVTAGKAPRDLVLVTVESVLASDVHDLGIVLVLPAAAPDTERLRRELAGDGRVRVVTAAAGTAPAATGAPGEDPWAWSPHRVRLDAGVTVAPGTLRALGAASGVGTIDAGVVTVPLPAAPDGQLELLVTRATARAHSLGARAPEEVRAAVTRWFGARQLDAAEVGVAYDPEVELHRLRAIALPAPIRERPAEGHPARVAAWQLLDGPVGWQDRQDAGGNGRGVVHGTPAGQEPPAARDALPGLRILHLGAVSRFGALATCTVLTAQGWRQAIEHGGDLVLVEPPHGSPGWDPLRGELPALFDAARAAGIPSARIHAGRQDTAAPGRADVELVETAELAGSEQRDRLPPSVDTTTFNPSGWTREPPEATVAALACRPDAGAARVLITADPTPTLLLPPELRRQLDPGLLRTPGGMDRTRGVASPATLARQLRRAGVLLDHPGWRADPDDRWRSWLAALACGTPVVTVVDAPAPGTPGDPTLPPPPPGVLAVPPDEVADTLHRLLVDADARERRSIVGRRAALRTADRRTALVALLHHLGIPAPAPPATTVLLSTHRPDLLDHAMASVRRQRHPGVDVSLVLHGPGFDGVDVPTRDLDLAQVVRAPASWTLGDCLDAALAGAGGHLVTKMDDDDHYGPHHLTDLVLAWRYSGAEVVGKRIEFIHLADRDVTLRRRPSPPERDRLHVGGPTLLAARDTLRRFGFLRVPSRVDSTLYERVQAAGGRVYGTHSRDVVLSRRGGAHGHAWQVTDEALLDGALWTRSGLDLAAASSEPPVDG